MEELNFYDYERAEKVAKRTLEFYNGKRGKVLMHIRSCGTWKHTQKIPPLNSLRFPEDMERYLDILAQKDAQMAAQHDQLEDDMIWTAGPFYGQAEHSAFIGGKVDFATDTSYHHKVCEEIGDFRKLKLEPDNMWTYLVAGGISYMRQKWGEYIPVRMRGGHGPSDFANILRGNDVLYDIYDEPEELQKMMKFCAEATKFNLDLQREQATKIAGGCVNGFCVWMPGKCVGHIGEDLSTMLSPETYEEYFLPALKECVSDCDMAMLHTHTLGARMLPVFAKVDNIQILEIANDPNTARASEIYRQYHDVLKDKIVVLKAKYDELLSMQDLFEDTKTIIWYEASDEEDAKRAMELVEKYR